MKKIVALFAAAVLSLTLLSACSSPAQQQSGAEQSGTEKVKVAVSFNAMKEFVQAVGKDKVDIVSVIPDGTEPHDFQPTPKDMKSLHDAKLFVYNGFGMEPWAQEAIKAADNSKLTVVEATKGIEPIALTDPDEIKEHGANDPHTWLSLVNAQAEVKNIADGLAKADPKNADFYQKNATEYNGQLQKLLDEYKGKFQNAPRKDLVTGHAAFAYLCRDFGLTQNSVEDVFASGEPSAQRLAELVSYCKEHQVKTVFVEEAVSPKTSETLAKEVGAKTQVIHTMEGSEGTKTYLDRMKENLEEIYAAMQ